jgi:hypothetical protein
MCLYMNMIDCDDLQRAPQISNPKEEGRRTGALGETLRIKIKIKCNEVVL